MKNVFRLINQDVRKRAIEFVLSAPDGWVVLISEPKRNLEQNAAQWPVLRDISHQLEWNVNGELRLMQPEEWKDVLTCGFTGESPSLAESVDQRGVVMIGHRTKEFSKKRFGEWLEYLHWFCAEKMIKLRGY